MDDKAETVPPFSEQRPKVSDEKNPKRRRLDDGLGKVGPGEKSPQMVEYAPPPKRPSALSQPHLNAARSGYMNINLHEPPFVTQRVTTGNTSLEYPKVSSMSLPPILPPSLARRPSYGGPSEVDAERASPRTLALDIASLFSRPSLATIF